MSTATTTRLVNLGQLGSDLGTTALSMVDDGTTRTITCHAAGYTNAQLQAAVDNHNAIDEAGNKATIQQQALTALQTNRDFLAVASPTNAQAIAQTKALSRQINGVIRLLLGKLDGTD